MIGRRHRDGASGPGPVDVARRDRSVITAVYALAERLTPDPARTTTPIHEHLALGRFERSFRSADSMLPRVVGRWSFERATLSFPAWGRRWAGLSGSVLLLVSPRGDLCLLLQHDTPPGAGAGTIAELLAAGCFDRDELHLDGVPLLEQVSRWAAGVAPALSFERDVHQVVLPGGRLLEAILRASSASPGRRDSSALLGTLVTRGTVRRGTGALRAPDWLNTKGSTVGVHGRGVSVLAGWSGPAENALCVVPALVIFASVVLKRVRAEAFASLAAAEQADARTTKQARAAVDALSERLSEMQLDLSFGVESYVDGVLLPELLIETFLASLGAATALPEGLANTSRILQRVTSVIDVRRDTLSTRLEARRDYRVRLLSNVVAVGSVLALPPALLLAYFGVNSSDVDPEASILDVGRYWAAYLVAFAPFVLLLTAAYLRILLRLLAERKR